MRKIIAVFLAAALLLLGAGCSREGFGDAKSNKNSSSSDASSQSSGEEEGSEVFELETGELTEAGVYMAYALPRGRGEKSEVASVISLSIHSILMALPQQFDLSEDGASLEVYDSVTRNDGKLYSVMYDGAYLPRKGAQKEEFCFGLAFDAVSGNRLVISDVTDLKTLSILALDAQSSTIKQRDEQVVAQQREILEQMGSDELYDILLESEQENIMALMDVSFYLDGADIVAVISRADQPKGAIRVAIKL